MDQTEAEEEKVVERDRKKTRRNKSKREKFWPERKSLSFEVLSSPSERFVDTCAHARTHAHTQPLENCLVRTLCNSKRSERAESMKGETGGRKKEKYTDRKFKSK